ncbi:MAG: hypothetical protein ACLU9S_10920 [Oscillospiraceae bacterium]
MTAGQRPSASPVDQDSETGFFTPHTYHVDIRFEMGFTQPHELADAIMQAVHRGKRVVVEHFDLIYPFLSTNANLAHRRGRRDSGWPGPTPWTSPG